jgi:hypothetical protein
MKFDVRFCIGGRRWQARKGARVERQRRSSHADGVRQRGPSDDGRLHGLTQLVPGDGQFRVSS